MTGSDHYWYALYNSNQLQGYAQWVCSNLAYTGNNNTRYIEYILQNSCTVDGYTRRYTINKSTIGYNTDNKRQDQQALRAIYPESAKSAY